MVDLLGWMFLVVFALIGLMSLIGAFLLLGSLLGSLMTWVFVSASSVCAFILDLFVENFWALSLLAFGVVVVWVYRAGK